MALPKLLITLGGVSTKKYSFSFAKVKLTMLDTTSGGKNQPVFQKIKWEAFKDATDTICKVTRVP